MIARRFRSPLLGTALVLVALAVLAVPLHRLTARNSGNTDVGTTAETARETTRAVLRIRLLDAWSDLEIQTTEGSTFFHAQSIEPGEIEQDVDILLDNGFIELHICGQTGDKDTAVFVTLLPDGHEERTAYALGSGRIEETLGFEWELHHE